MKSIVFSKRSLKCKDSLLTTLPQNWATVEVNTVGLCGTDVAKFRNYKLPVKHTNILGHEFIGKIVKMNGKSSSVVIGDFVVCMPILPCDCCEECLNGRENLCVEKAAIGRTVPGAFAEYVNVPIKNLIEINNSVYRKAYVLADPLAVCLHAVKSANVKSTGGKVLIIGDGSIGCLLAWFLSKQNRNVSIKGIHSDNLHFVNALGMNLQNVVDISTGTYDEVYEIVGRKQEKTLNECIKAVKPGGIVVVLGVYSADFIYPLAARDLFIKESKMVGVNAYTRGDFFEAVNFIRDNEKSLIKFISHSFVLEDFSGALDAMRNKRGLTLKIILEIGDSS